MTPAELQGLLSDALRQAGHPASAAVVCPPPDRTAPLPPEGPWVVLPLEGWSVGGVSRGAYRPYRHLTEGHEVIALVLGLLSPTTSPRGVDRTDLAERGRRTARAIAARCLERQGAAGPAALAAGDVIEVVGTPSAHHAYAYGTPFEHRSLPPTALGAPRHVYEVRSALSLSTEGLTAAWFEQPGGGPMVALGYPVQWHVEQGELLEVTPV
ncbi:TNT domain-containing protein [Ornithinimicrobium tianjinense]|uniref:TNT domain-containing protein n=1 Tax=Ornithinimicrobium tianjinense TaxID=1195761 RepID=A0A917F932_9MICO|nr:TNT domain-containing protein [Ornithinimicrobium tianjinense]GGF58915.1 hypothetical protein GCM10011366_28430 [Ornithinimicrobium tianjinense]